jgi:lysylphosphatidylglycerol synthetase-like protein (DUF2156 family)
MGMQVKVTPGDVVAVTFFVGAVFWVLTLMQEIPLDTLATPTPVSIVEMGAAVSVFVACVIVLQPAKEIIERSGSSISRLLRLRVELPRPVRVAALVLFVGGTFAFAFWSIADVLGGYNGYGYSFSTYPILQVIHNSTIGLVPIIGSRDKGTQASFYFTLAILGLVTFRLNRGIWTALKDTVTLYAAPCLVAFELALWNYAPEDMTWHVTDYLWMGGTNDGGYRALDVGGAFLVSNWLVLCVALLIVASRIPWMSLPSRVIWRRYGTEP